MDPNGLPIQIGGSDASGSLSQRNTSSFSQATNSPFTSLHTENARSSSIVSNNYPGNESLSEQQEANKAQRVSYLMRNTNLQQTRPSNFGVNNPVYRPGRGAERLREYVMHQKNRPRDNNIQYWKNLVAEFFAPTATKRWCIASYKDTEEIDDIFKVTWKCNLCHSMPCYGLEINEHLLPRLHQIKYDVGILEEELLIETPIEYVGGCGQIFLHYPRATVESEFNQVRIVHHGQLRVVFSPDLKICSWEFCAEHHTEYMDRTSILPQASQLVAAMRNFQHTTQNSSSATLEELKRHSDEFISSAEQMLTALGRPLISQRGQDMLQVRSIQISEVLSVTRNLIHYSYTLAPKQNLGKFPHPSNNVRPKKKLKHHFEQHRSSTTSSSSYVEDRAGVGRTSGLYGNRLGSMKTSCSVRPIHPQQQHTFPTQTPQIFFPTPLLRPQISHTTIGTSGTELAAANVHMEPKTSTSTQQPYQLNFDDPNGFCSTVGRIIQEVTTDQLHNRVGGITGHSVTTNNEGNMVSGSNNDFGGSNADTSNRIEVIDVENYQFKQEGIDVSAPEIGTTSGAQVETEIFPKDAQGNYLPPEYNDDLPFEFVDFGDYSDLLE